jgi:hypothetical protein
VKIFLELSHAASALYPPSPRNLRDANARCFL